MSSQMVVETSKVWLDKRWLHKLWCNGNVFQNQYGCSCTACLFRLCLYCRRNSKGLSQLLTYSNCQWNHELLLENISIWLLSNQRMSNKTPGVNVTNESLTIICDATTHFQEKVCLAKRRLWYINWTVKPRLYGVRVLGLTFVTERILTKWGMHSSSINEIECLIGSSHLYQIVQILNKLLPPTYAHY